jgi:hypothetical protein
MTMHTMQRLSEWFLTVFGDIKVFRFPFFLVYDPGSYQVKGDGVRALLGVLQPGDILLRSYSNYLDGKFIPGKFSHAGLDCGPVHEDDRALVGTRQRSRGARDGAQSALFHTGAQMVVHAMAEGVFIEDSEAIPREEFTALATTEALRNVGRAYNFGFNFSDFKRLSCSELGFPGVSR